jgi:hypothetical protein
MGFSMQLPHVPSVQSGDTVDFDTNAGKDVAGLNRRTGGRVFFEVSLCRLRSWRQNR